MKERTIFQDVRRLFVTVSSLLMLTTLPMWQRAVVCAQDKSSSEVTINQIDSSGFPQITLFVSVQDGSGKMIRNLQSQDFTVTEDEVEQSPLALETHLPSMAMALVLDTSGSMKGAIETAGRAASSFANLVRPEDEIMVLTFSDRVQVAETFSKDKEAVKRAIGAIKARGNTALYDAAWQAVRSFDDKAGRKAVILLTDGKDDDGTGKPLSKKTADDVIAAAKEINVPLFTIGLGSEIDVPVLQKIASESGGQYFASPSAEDLASLYEHIGAQLTGQYLLRYTTNLTDRDGSWHRVVVKVAGNTAQKQYMAPLDQAAPPPPKAEPPAQTAIAPRPTAKKANINVVAASQGARLLMATSQYNDDSWAAQNLFDEAIGADHEYSSESAKTPQEILVELPKTGVLTSMIIDPYTTETEKNWAKDVEVWVSLKSPYDGFQKVTSVTVDNTRMESQDPTISLTVQTFPLPETKARWIKIVLLNNYGGSYIQLGEIKLMGFFTEEGTTDPLAQLHNVFSKDIGGKLLYFSSQYNDNSWAAKNLIDGQLGDGYGYSSEDSQPVEILFVLPKVVSLTHVAFNPFTVDPPENWAREVEIQVSVEGPKQGFQSAGIFTLHNFQNLDKNQPLPDQTFSITPVEARFIKLILLKNHGGSYIQLGEFKALTPKQ